MTEELLASESLLAHLVARPDFAPVLQHRTKQFMAGCAAVLYGGTEFAQADGYWTGLEERVSARVLQLLPTELPRVHSYCDGALQLQTTLKERLRRLTPQQFEQVLHPVFQVRITHPFPPSRLAFAHRAWPIVLWRRRTS